MYTEKMRRRNIVNSINHMQFKCIYTNLFKYLTGISQNNMKHL